MKVIFLQDVPNVAQVGEIKEVADGYGRNFLIPKQLAMLAKPSATSTVEAQQRLMERRQQRTEVEMAELANQIEGKEIIIEAKAGSKDRLFGSITTTDIAAELQKITGQVIDKRKIELSEPIRHLGNYEVTIKLAKNIAPKIRVSVIGKETSESGQ